MSSGDGAGCWDRNKALTPVLEDVDWGNDSVRAEAVFYQRFTVYRVRLWSERV